MRHRLILVIVGALVVTGAGCSSSDEIGVPGVDSSIDGTTSVESSIGGNTPVAPTGVPLVEGLPVVEVLGPPEAGAGEAPLFSWKPVAGASRPRPRSSLLPAS